MSAWLNKLFTPEINAKSEFSFRKPEMERIMKQNRNSLSTIDDWIDDKAFQNSFFQYGVPDFIKKEINKPIGDSMTYTDVMVYIAKEHFKKVNYLEIGVSVGKNFFQLLNALNESQFTAFDIEEINPVLANRFVLKEKTEWPTPVDSIKKTNSSLTGFEFEQKRVNYLCADVWDENSWARLEGNRFNLVFSDALHSHKAILFEFEMLVKYNLLDEKFVIVWDDLVGKMRNSFFKIIKKYNNNFKIKDVYLLSINGWVGQNEKPHSVGIISNFSL